MTKNQCQQFSSSFQKSTTISIFLVILVLFANVYVLLFPDLIFKPLVIALVVSFVLKCSINFMRRVKNPRVIAVVTLDDSCKPDFIRYSNWMLLHRKAETNLHFDGWFLVSPDSELLCCAKFCLAYIEKYCTLHYKMQRFL